MPDYTVEVTYHLPVYRQRSYSADTPAQACRLAIEDDGWGDAREDADSSGESHVTGIWEGADAAYSGQEIPVPSHFAETVQRKAGHFDMLLDALRILSADARAKRIPSPEVQAKAAWAIVRGEAILAGARDPDDPMRLPPATFTLAVLDEDRVRRRIATLLATDRRFQSLTPQSVHDADIQAAFAAVTADADLSRQVTYHEFQAAYAALTAASQRISQS
ncbi:hypothetical protein D3P06_00830 [Paracoccus aestuarii]|uniref:Uncharacterized protein n=1 Tax=Paracoccus aestuarii TaxID=453842 RepID=A0A419A2C3_9RHOB|nr:hypothetical protein [Paracoccus aestuarii]RJL07316.1 hypothetical protein D3P06_00830 [Paracoccus aestuarii]WCR00061.1 hypothetical protein JHW48_04960 [Paracoccus aestuarii]